VDQAHPTCVDREAKRAKPKLGIHVSAFFHWSKPMVFMSYMPNHSVKEYTTEVSGRGFV